MRSSEEVSELVSDWMEFCNLRRSHITLGARSRCPVYEPEITIKTAAYNRPWRISSVLNKINNILVTKTGLFQSMRRAGALLMGCFGVTEDEL